MGRIRSFTGLGLFAFLISTLFIVSIAFAESDGDLPNWLKRTEYSVVVETDKKPTYYLQSVQPLYQSDDKTHTVFVQPRASVQAERATYNLGFGYRKLVENDWILGVNFFGDYEEDKDHARIGAGLEALGQVVEARLNSYFGNITSKRVVETTGAGEIVESVADGLDFELGAPVPYVPWLKVYGSGFWYKFDQLSHRHGWKFRSEAKLNDTIRLEVFTWDDNKGDIEVGGQFRFQVAFNDWEDIKEAFTLSDEKFPEKNLSEELLIPVERNHEIVVERYERSTGFIVEAGRS